MSITGDPGGPPTKVGVALLDLIAGLECAVGALAALVGRGRVGHVHVDLVEVGVSSLVNVLANHLASGDVPGRHGNAHPNIAPYESFEAREGHLVIAVGNDAQFAQLLAVLGLEDPNGRYATNALRVVGRPTLRDWLGERIALRDRDELVEALARADVPAGPVNTVPEAVAAMGDGWAQQVEGMTLAPSPIRVDGATSMARGAPPRLGQHTDAVLSELDAPGQAGR